MLVAMTRDLLTASVMSGRRRFLITRVRLRLPNLPQLDNTRVAMMLKSAINSLMDDGIQSMSAAVEARQRPSAMTSPCYDNSRRTGSSRASALAGVRKAGSYRHLPLRELLARKPVRSHFPRLMAGNWASRWRRNGWTL